MAPTSASHDPAATSIDGRRAADLWTALVQRLAASGAIAAMVRELAMQAECLCIVDGAAERLWQLRVERENLRAPALRERVQGIDYVDLRFDERLYVRPAKSPPAANK